MIKLNLSLVILAFTSILTISATPTPSKKNKIIILELLNVEMLPSCYAIKFKTIKTNEIGWFLIEKKEENKNISKLVNVGDKFRLKLKGIKSQYNCGNDNKINIRGHNTEYYMDGYKIFQTQEFENQLFPE